MTLLVKGRFESQIPGVPANNAVGTPAAARYVEMNPDRTYS
jgi:hypothetical protein